MSKIVVEGKDVQSDEFQREFRDMVYRVQHVRDKYLLDHFLGQILDELNKTGVELGVFEEEGEDTPLSDRDEELTDQEIDMLNSK